MRQKGFVWVLLAVAALAVAVYTAPVLAQSGEKHEDGHGHDHGAMAKKAICVLTPTEGNEAHGEVMFEEVEGGVKITATVHGLNPGQKHGFHVHQYGDISAADGTAAGGHFNPHGVDHAGPDAETRHVGDFGNIEADENGVGHYERVDTMIKIGGDSPNNIIGHGLIVHKGTDDLKSQPTGDAGARIAQGVIGYDE